VLSPKTENRFRLLKDPASPDFGKTYLESLPSRAFPTLQWRFDLFGRFKVAPAFDYRSASNCQCGRIDLSDHERVVFQHDVLSRRDLPLEESIDHSHRDLDVRSQLALFGHYERAIGANLAWKLVV
jgi:hypothetical protein